jgi:hypothetical protein
MVTVSPTFLLKRFRNAKSDPKFGWRGVVLVIPIPGRKVPERFYGLRPSEKEFPERRSDAFRHKNAPDYS